MVLGIIMQSCRIGSGDQGRHIEPESSKDPATLESLASEFPASKIDELVTPISQDELSDVITSGQTKEWTSTQSPGDLQEIIVRNKLAPDNLVRFVLYQGNPVVAMIVVQQENAQVVTTEVWEYRLKVADDHPDRWNQYLLPDYRFESFFDERVILPEAFRGKPAKSYLDYKLGVSSITVSLNKWTFMRELEGNSVSPAGALDPALIKYKYVLNWNGDDFVEEKVKEAGYSDALMFTSSIVEPRTDGGPGVHEFDCPHGVSVKTSSMLAKQGRHDYKPSNMVDSSKATAWAEGVEGSGVGEWIEFTITSQYHIGSSWQISNGYTSNKDVWQANNRVKKMKVLVDDQLVGYVMLANVSAFQEFNIAPFWLKDPPSFKKGTRIRFVIEEVYRGSRYDDTLISYFVPTGNCG
jgi:hypothetical protein